MQLTRRKFVGFSVGAAAARYSPAWAVPLPRDADIVVIGAGAAGIGCCAKGDCRQS